MKVKIIVIMMLFCAALFSASISGFITNAANGEKIRYASAVIEGKEQGAYSNDEGYFVINRVAPGKIKLHVSAIGYRVKILELEITEVNEQKIVNLELQPAAVAIEGIEVTADRFDNLKINQQEIEIAKLNIRSATINEIVEIGEPDVLRAIQNMPGVTSISDFSSGLYVRGGTPDQNLILLDGIDVYNPTHFGGIFSTFNPDAISNVELLKGGFPAAYGGRLASVLKITNLDGNRKHHQGSARISLISSSATLQGPWKIGQHKGSYMASFRRTYMDLFRKGAELFKVKGAKNFPNYFFYDGHAKVNLDLTNHDFLSFSYYSGKDYLKLDESLVDKFHLDWGNNTFSTTWTHVFSPQLLSKFLIASSNYKSEFIMQQDEMREEEEDDFAYDRTNIIQDYSIKANMDYRPNKKHQIKFGLDTKINQISYEEIIDAEDFDPDIYHPDLKLKSFSTSCYIQDSWKFADFWTLQPGIRVNQYLTQSDYLAGKPSENFYNYSPRISLRHEISNSSNAYISYGRYYQYLNSLTASFAPLDIWLPLDKTLVPSSADHYIAGYKILLGKNHVLDVEAYYKNLKNVTEYRDNSNTNWASDDITMADLFNVGKGYSYGLEVMFRSQMLGLEGFTAYSYGVTKKKIENENINETTGKEEYFSPRYDRTHSFNMVETYNLTEHTGVKIFGGETTISLTYKYGSGQPYKTPEMTLDEEGQPLEVFNYREGKRLKDYHRLDVSFKFKKFKKHYNFEPYIQIINVTNHRNEYRAEFSEQEDENGNIYYEKSTTHMLPIIPFFGFNYSW